MLLVDCQIRELCRAVPPMIEPFSEAVSGGGVISYGLSHAGYDLRLGPDFVWFTCRAAPLDPKAAKEHDYERTTIHQGERLVLRANSYVLGRSLEYLRIPRDIKGRCVGKSTLARVGVLINTTPLEPGWHGHLTIEIGNVTPRPVALYVGEGCCQIEFEQLAAAPERDYGQKGGQYQGQKGVTTARVKP